MLRWLGRAVVQTETRVVLAVGLVTVLMLVGLVLHRQAEQGRIRRLFEQRVEEENAAFDKLLELKGEALAMFVYDYTYWDEMVRFTRTLNPVWAEENLVQPLATYRADAVWVFDTAGAPLFSACRGDSTPRFSLPEQVLEPLRQGERFIHCFVPGPDGPVELCGATIHPTDDPERKTPAYGLFIVGRNWDARFTGELSRGAAGCVRVAAGPAGEHGPHQSFPERGVMFLSRDLVGPDGSAVAHIGMSKQLHAVAELNRASGRQFIILLSFGLAVMMVVALAMVVLVTQPLSVLNRTLAEARPELLDRLKKNRTEFGRLAGLVCDFFEQREELELYRGRLEELVDRRTRELNAAYTKLVQQERLATLGQVSGSIAHEIRNPLAAIANAAYYLRRKVVAEPGSRVERHLAIIEEQITRANEVISSLLQFARGATPEPQTTDVAGLVSTAMAQARLPKEVKVRQEIEPGLSVRADPTHLAHALANLLTNASQAMEGRGQVVIQAARQNGRVAIRVVDSGPGIAPENLSRVFEPLYSTKAFGVGLGLPICKSLVQANQGTIELRSEPGKGTTAVISLPAAGSRMT